jgi:hypothetical protein
MTHFSQKLILSARIGAADLLHSWRGPEYLSDIDNPLTSIHLNSFSRGASWL